VIDLQIGNLHVFTIILFLGSADEFVVMNLICVNIHTSATGRQRWCFHRILFVLA